MKVAMLDIESKISLKFREVNCFFFTLLPLYFAAAFHCFLYLHMCMCALLIFFHSA